MKKVSTKQIELMINFIKTRYVECYDLQTELVDHLANDIEAQWENHPKRSFNAAFHEAFKKFGKYGFKPIVAKHNKVLRKMHYKIIFQYLKTYLKFPKLILTIFATLVTFGFFELVKGSDLGFFAIFIMSMLFMVPFVLKNKKQYEAVLNTKKRHWKLEELLITSDKVKSYFSIPFWVIAQFGITVETDTIYHIGIAFFAVLSFLVMYVTVVEIPKNREKILKEIYPEYKSIA